MICDDLWRVCRSNTGFYRYLRRIIFFIFVVVLLFSIQVQVYMYAPITNTYIKRGVCIYLIHSTVILVNDKCVCLFCFFTQDVTAGWSTPQRWMGKRLCGMWTAAWFLLNGTSFCLTLDKLVPINGSSRHMSNVFLLCSSGTAGCTVWQTTHPPHTRWSPRSSMLRFIRSTWPGQVSSMFPIQPPARRSRSGFHLKLQLSEVWPQFLCKLCFLYHTWPE